MNRLTQLLKQFKGRRVAVLGDFVADVFVYGEISRISREAPVLILNHRETQLVPGGGANAVHNLRALGADPQPFGFVGNDAEGRQLLAFFKKLGIDTKGIRVERSWKTPAKMRILAGAPHSQRQQIVRLDSGGPIKAIPKLKALAAGGTFSEAARLANYAGGIVVMKHGTRPVTYAELLRAVRENES